jgi:peptide/nickel transport system substrate-binding protein
MAMHRPNEPTDVRREAPGTTRRAFLAGLGLALGGVAAGPLLAACGGAPAAAPTAAPKPAAAEPTKPPALPPTTAPATVAVPTAAPKADTFMRAPEPNPKKGGTLRTAYGITVSHYDFHQGGGGPLVMAFDNLVALNMTDGFATIVPELAESWQISDDRKTYTFKMREGVKFHDGTPFSAEDVVATYRRILEPPAGVVSVYKPTLEAVDKVELVDKMTMRFVLKYPWQPFLAALTGVNMVIYSKKHLEENNNDLKKVVAPGTGAFIHKEYRTGELWVFERNPNYWNPNLPYIDRLEMLHVPAWTDRGTAVLSGQADFSWNTSKETHDEGKRRSDIVNVRVLPHFGAAYHFVLNNQRKPFNDPRVRRAIHLAVSRQNLIKAFATQEFITMSRWVSHANLFAMKAEELAKLPGYRESKDEDVAAARKLLAEAGYADGFEAELMTADVAPHAQIMAPAFQEELRRTLNIRTKIRPLERAILNDFLTKGDYDIQLSVSWGSDMPDPELMLNKGLRTGSSQNYAKYSNPKVDKLLDELRQATADADRDKIVRQMLDTLDEDPPFYMIGFADHLPMWRTFVKGIVANWRHTQWGRLHTVWLDK